jgi:DHA1 family bicyclomycin/chloramphenicol resistance-like MFS transporter
MTGALSIDAYLPALPAIAQNFHVSAASTQQTLTIYLCGFAFMVLLYGTLSDSFGRRPVILASLGFYLASSLGAALAPNLGWLMACRLMQGLSASAGRAVGVAMVGDLLAGAEAQRTLALIGVVFGLAPALAPVLGGWLLSVWGWRSIFLSIALFTVLLLAACLLWLPESLKPENRHPFHFKVIARNYWSVASHQRFILQTLGISLSYVSLMLYVGSAPAFVFNLLHLSAREFAWLFGPIIGGLTLGSIFSSILSHKLKPGTLIQLGYGLMIAAAAWNVTYTAIYPPRIPWAVLPLFFFAIPLALSNPAMTLMNLQVFPGTRGLAASLQTFSFMILFAIGSGVICPLLFGSAFHLALGSASGLVLSLVCWTLGRRTTA